MRAKVFGRTAAVGIGLALAAAIPAASQARATVNQGPAASAQALNGLDARWNAEAASFKAAQARLRASHALKKLDASWTVAPRRYGMH